MDKVKEHTLYICPMCVCTVGCPKCMYWDVHEAVCYVLWDIHYYLLNSIGLHPELDAILCVKHV